MANKKLKPLSISVLGVVLLSIGALLTPSVAADPDTEPELETIFIETQENTSVYGYSVWVVYDQPD